MTAALQTAVKPTWRQRVLRLLPWHRRLALLACFGVFSWALSGMLHPLMSALQPRPAAFMPPAVALALDGLQAPGAVLQQAGIAQVQALRLLMLDGQPWYQARLQGQSQPRYWHARTGAPADLASAHAEVLARHYLGTQEPLAYTGNLEQFNAEYAYINRLLPAARVDTQRDNGLRVYVDLYQDRLGTLVDTPKAIYSQLFLWLHSFRWLDAAGPLRPALMMLLLAATLAACTLGAGMFIARRKARSTLHKLHGYWGIGIVLSTLLFVFSGAWHLLHKLDKAPAPLDVQAQFNSADLPAAPTANWLLDGESLHKLSLLQLDGRPVWRLQGMRYGKPALRYLGADGSALDDLAPLRYAQQRFATYAGKLGLETPATITLQRQFDHDYGFVFKRLPVLKASYADDQNTALFVDPLDGALAAVVDDTDRAEGFSFAYLHKWDFLSALGKPLKDGFVTLLALAHVLLVIGGLWLWRRRRAT